MKNFNYLLVTLFAAGALVACGKKEEVPVVETPAVDETPSVEGTPSTDEYIEPEFNLEEVVVNVEGTLADAYLAIREVYGNDYLPNMEIPTDLLTEVYGVEADHIAQVVAEQPMIGMHPDKFIAIEATEGNAEAVEAALIAYHEQLLADTMQYPMNLAKIAASEVVRHDNFVFFMLLGAINEDVDASEEDAAVFAKEEMQKGLDALTTVFNQ